MHSILSSLLIVAILFGKGSESKSLNLTSVSDGACTKIPTISLEDFNLDLAFQFMDRAAFVPMASKMNYITFAQMFQPDKEIDLQQLEKNFCLKISVGVFETLLTGFGGAQFELTCDLVDLAAVTCLEKDYPAHGNIKMNWVWSDSDGIMLSVSCLHDKFAAWNVLSFEPTINDAKKALILQQLEKYGFNRNNDMALSYNNC